MISTINKATSKLKDVFRKRIVTESFEDSLKESKEKKVLDKINQWRKDNKYWIINPFVNFFAGMATGYVLEKSGAPMSELDIELQVGVPVGLGSLEYITKKYIKKQNYTSGLIIAGSSALGVATFHGGNTAGRYLANLF